VILERCENYYANHYKIVIYNICQCVEINNFYVKYVMHMFTQQSLPIVKVNVVQMDASYALTYMQSTFNVLLHNI